MTIQLAFGVGRMAFPWLCSSALPPPPPPSPCLPFAAAVHPSPLPRGPPSLPLVSRDPCPHSAQPPLPSPHYLPLVFS